MRDLTGAVVVANNWILVQNELIHEIHQENRTHVFTTITVLPESLWRWESALILLMCKGYIVDRSFACFGGAPQFTFITKAPKFFIAFEI
jgi:hypothetical protein